MPADLSRLEALLEAYDLACGDYEHGLSNGYDLETYGKAVDEAKKELLAAIAEIVEERDRLKAPFCEVHEWTLLNCPCCLVVRLDNLLTAHRRFHGKAGCPGLPECYVCKLEEQ